jgi:hypothetical protein
MKEENVIEIPNHPGWCPFYSGENGNDHCGLSGSMPASGHRDYNCKSSQNCKTCGAYEAWENGTNYR